MWLLYLIILALLAVAFFIALPWLTNIPEEYERYWSWTEEQVEEYGNSE